MPVDYVEPRPAAAPAGSSTILVIEDDVAHASLTAAQFGVD